MMFCTRINVDVVLPHRAVTSLVTVSLKIPCFSTVSFHTYFSYRRYSFEAKREKAASCVERGDVIFKFHHRMSW